VNMLTDALPAAALAVSPPSNGETPNARAPDDAVLWRTVAVRGVATAGAATGAWTLARFTGRQRRAATVALIALVAAQLGQTLLESHSRLVVFTALGSLAAMGVVLRPEPPRWRSGCFRVQAQWSGTATSGRRRVPPPQATTATSVGSRTRLPRRSKSR
jgi:magnesium-transporting ATPase (P-type)